MCDGKFIHWLAFAGGVLPGALPQGMRVNGPALPSAVFSWLVFNKAGICVAGVSGMHDGIQRDEGRKSVGCEADSTGIHFGSHWDGGVE